GIPLPVLDTRNLLRPGYPAGLYRDVNLFPITGNAPRPNIATTYIRDNGYGVTVVATLDDGHVIRPDAEWVTVHGRRMAIESPERVPSPATRGPVQWALWQDHGWVVSVSIDSDQSFTDRAELMRVLNGLVWP